MRRSLLSSGAKGQPAHIISFPRSASDHRERRRLRRIRVRAGNRQEPQRHLRLLGWTPCRSPDYWRWIRTPRPSLAASYPKDGLPKKIDALPIAFVCNTDDGDEPGEHWIALYLSSDGRGEYFCSYGLPPRHATFRTFLNKHCSEWTHNSKRLQSPLSNVCGQYCVTYIMLRCNGSPMGTFVNAFHTDLVANDCRVFDWINLLKKGLPYYCISYID